MTAHGGARRALITNDDGIFHEGLRHLAVAARDAGLEVIVAGPRDEQSGTGASLQSTRQDGRVLIEDHPLEGLEGVTCVAVASAPAFIVRLACRGAFGEPPDVVLSGINRGANTGRAILHSGTVGAALTAQVHGCPALAVSLAGAVPTHWDTAATLAMRALPDVLDAHRTLALNINSPDLPLTGLRGVRDAGLAAFGAVQMTIAEVGRGYVRLGTEATGEDHEPGTDAALLAEGFATVTALDSVSRMAGVELGHLMPVRAS